MERINFQSPKYDQYNGENACIHATIGGQHYVIPIANDNPKYLEIMRQVEAGELTIAPADEEE